MSNFSGIVRSVSNNELIVEILCPEKINNCNNCSCEKPDKVRLINAISNYKFNVGDRCTIYIVSRNLIKSLLVVVFLPAIFIIFLVALLSYFGLNRMILFMSAISISLILEYLLIKAYSKLHLFEAVRLDEDSKLYKTNKKFFYNSTYRSW